MPGAEDLKQSPRETPAAAPLDWVEGDPGALRRAYVKLRAERRHPAEEWARYAAPWTVKALVHRPRRERDRGTTILYFHGGGWFVGSPMTHAAIGRQLAKETGLAVHSVDYRLVPGHSAYAPIRDGLAVLRRLVRAGSYRRFVLAGDSAGAAVALGVARFAEQRYRHTLLGILAFYGAYGLLQSPSIRSFGRREDGLDEASLASLYRLLARISGSHPFTVPILAGRRLPPTHLFVGDKDPLLSDSVALYGALRTGTPVQLTVVAGAEHSFLHQVAVSKAAQEAIEKAARSIAAWMGGSRDRLSTPRRFARPEHKANP